MSIMDMFRLGVPKVASPALPDPDDGAKKQQQQQQQQNSGNEPPKDESPLAAWASLFQTDPNAKQTGENDPPAFNIDPTKIAEVAGKTDFTKQIPAETLKKIAAGGEDAVAAFAQAMNSVGQNTYAQSALVSAKLIESALQRQADYFQKTVIPQVVRQVGSDESLRDQNPILNHAAVAPVADAIKAQLAAKNPDASPKELAKMTNDFFIALASAVKPDQSGTQGSTKRGNNEQDWSAFLS